jgi:hypothetical protein
MNLLALAAQCGHTATVDVLLRHCADCEHGCLTVRVSIALHLAIFRGHTATVEVLLPYCPAAVFAGDWAVPLALKRGHRATVEALLRHTRGVVDEVLQVRGQ